MTYTWVTSKDVCDAARAVLTKDDSNLKSKGARIQLLDRLFKKSFLDYCLWKSAEEAMQQLTVRGKKRKRVEASDDNESKKAKSWSDIDSTSSNSSSDSESESESSSSAYSSDDDEHKQEEQQIDTSQFAEKTAIDDSLVIADTNSPTSASSSRIDQDTTFYYNADDEAELDEEIGW